MHSRLLASPPIQGLDAKVLSIQDSKSLSSAGSTISCPRDTLHSLCLSKTKSLTGDGSRVRSFRHLSVEMQIP